MLSDELLAFIKDAGHADLPLLINALSERFGESLKDQFKKKQAQNAMGRLPMLHIADLLAEPDEDGGFLIDKILPLNYFLLMTGKPKFGKSLISLDIAGCVATGNHLWGMHKVMAPGPVIYLAMEDGKREIKKRLKAYYPEYMDRGVPPIYICPERVLLSDEGNSEGMAMLEAEIMAISPSLVVIDTAREALGIRKWEDQAEIADKFRPLRDLARKYCTIIMVAHNRKADAEHAVDEIGGSNAVASSVDGWFSARTKEDFWEGEILKSRRLTLECDGRGGMAGKHVVEIDFSDLHVRRVASEKLAQERQERHQESKEKRYETIFGAILTTAEKKATIAQIAQTIGEEYDTVRHKVNGAVREGFLEELPGESKGRGRPTPLYRIIELSNNRTHPIHEDDNSIILKMGDDGTDSLWNAPTSPTPTPKTEENEEIF